MKIIDTDLYMNGAASIVLKKVFRRVMVSAYPCILFKFIVGGKYTKIIMYFC